MSNTVTLPLKDEKNFRKILRLVGFEDVYIMPELRSLPLWFQFMVVYPDRMDDLIVLLDKFGLERPSYMKDIRLPKDYTEEELDAIFENKKQIRISGRYGDDSCRYQEYYASFVPHQFDLVKALNKEPDFFNRITIYWSSLLENKLLTTEKYFTKIIEGLKSPTRLMDYYDFTDIYYYQDLTKEQCEELVDFIPFHSRRVDFFEKGMLLGSEKIADKFWEGNDSFYKSYKFDAMPVKYQLKYIEELKDESDKLSFLKKSKLSKEEKMNVLQNVINSK